MQFVQAVLALQWLSKLHAACWGQHPAGIWPQVLGYAASRMHPVLDCGARCPSPSLLSPQKTTWTQEITLPKVSLNIADESARVPSPCLQLNKRTELCERMNLVTDAQLLQSHNGELFLCRGRTGPWKNAGVI